MWNAESPAEHIAQEELRRVLITDVAHTVLYAAVVVCLNFATALWWVPVSHLVVFVVYNRRNFAGARWRPLLSVCVVIPFMCDLTALLYLAGRMTCKRVVDQAIDAWSPLSSTGTKDMRNCPSILDLVSLSLGLVVTLLALINSTTVLSAFVDVQQHVRDGLYVALRFHIVIVVGVVDVTSVWTLLAFMLRLVLALAACAPVLMSLIRKTAAKYGGEMAVLSASVDVAFVVWACLNVFLLKHTLEFAVIILAELIALGLKLDRFM